MTHDELRERSEEEKRKAQHENDDGVDVMVRATGYMDGQSMAWNGVCCMKIGSFHVSSLCLSASSRATIASMTLPILDFASSFFSV